MDQTRATAPKVVGAGPGAGDDFWVFGYGSLMWRPGFNYLERRVALLHGYRRRLCVLSHHHRGTPDRPGLVLGLDRGGACRGVAFRVAAARRADTIDYLRAREQVTGVYLETWTVIRFEDGGRAKALAYRVDRAHPQYIDQASRERLLELVRQGNGASGANPDYVLSTHRHLLEMGVRDATLAWLAARVS